MVYYLSWQDAFPVLPSNWQQYLPPWRIEKALAYKQEKDKITSVLAFLLLRFALFKEYNTVSMPQIETDENGKPFEVNKKYHFNLSHCDTAVACALNTAPVGIDVQDFRPVKSNVVRRVCSATEQNLLSIAEQPECTFAAFWASKEAYGKYTGQGIGFDLQRTCFCTENTFPCTGKTENCVVHTQLKENFALSVCSYCELPIMQVEVDELLCFLQEYCKK